MLPLAANFSLEYQNIAATVPYGVALLVCVLAYSFNKSRLFLATLNIILAYTLIQTGLQTSLNNPNAFVLFSHC